MEITFAHAQIAVLAELLKSLAERVETLERVLERQVTRCCTLEGRLQGLAQPVYYDDGWWARHGNDGTVPF